MNLGKLCIRSDLLARHALASSTDVATSLTASTPSITSTATTTVGDTLSQGIDSLADSGLQSRSSNVEVINSFYDKFVFEVTGMCANITDNLSEFDVLHVFYFSFNPFQGKI